MNPEIFLIFEGELMSLQTMANLAQTVGNYLHPCDVILLQGDLGAGKTTFAQFLIQHLMVTAVDVPSPTFPLICPYETKKGELWHVDLYRLQPQEVLTLGLEEQWRQGITLIEWPERLPFMPPDPLWVRLMANDITGTRVLSLKGSSSWKNRLCAVLNAMI